MIRTIFIGSILCLITTASAQAQPQAQSRFKDKIESLRIAFITKELDLSSAESEKFWPIYNDYLADKEDIEKEYATGPIKNVSDEKAEELINKYFEREEKLLDLKKLYFTKLRNVLPLPKIARLNRVETAFKEALLERLKEFRENRARRRNLRRNN